MIRMHAAASPLSVESDQDFNAGYGQHLRNNFRSLLRSSRRLGVALLPSVILLASGFQSAHAAAPSSWKSSECTSFGAPCKPTTGKKFHPGFYASFGIGKPKDQITDIGFQMVKGNSDFVGVARYWFWDVLETSLGVYDFSGIDADLAYAKSIGKQYGVIIISTDYHNSGHPRTPTYMYGDPKYGGGPVYHGSITNCRGYANCFEPVWWNLNVQARFAALMKALGDKYDRDPNFEYVMMDETDLAGVVDGYDWSPQREMEGFRANLAAAQRALPTSQVFQQINFTTSWDLETFSQWCANNGIGLGGPDVLPNSAWLNGPYPIQRKHHDQTAIEISVEWGNYDTLSSDEILSLAIAKVNPHYMVWDLTRSPYQTDVFSAVRKFIAAQGSAWPRSAPASVGGN